MHKTIQLFLMFYFFQAIPVIAGDRIDDSGWPPKIQASARQMIMAGIPRDDVNNMTQTMLNNRMQTRSILQAQQLVLSEQQAGYGYQQTADKIYEGLSKGVPSREIIQAMERIVQRNQTAAQLANKLAVQSKAREHLRDLIASSQAAGMRPQDAATLADRLRTQTRTQDRQQLCEQCYLTARELVRRGVPSDAAMSMINQSLDQQYSAGEIATLRKSFIEQNRKQPASPLAQEYINRISSGCPANDLGGAGNASGTGKSNGNSDAGGNTGPDSSGEANGSGSNSNSGESNGSSGGAGSSGDNSGGNGGDNGGNGGDGGNGGGGHQ